VRESTLEKRFTEKIKAVGGYPAKLQVIGHSGFPDRMVFTPGGPVRFAELKAPGEKLDPLQVKVCQMIEGYTGFEVPKIDSRLDIDRFIDSLVDVEWR
jgi:hypothetical protein